MFIKTMKMVCRAGGKKQGRALASGGGFLLLCDLIYREQIGHSFSKSISRNGIIRSLISPKPPAPEPKKERINVCRRRTRQRREKAAHQPGNLAQR
jgi:hypothetical protein